MRCVECGAENRSQAHFCSQCGRVLDSVPDLAPPVVSQAVPEATTARGPRRRPAFPLWLLGIGMAILSCTGTLCLAFGLAIAPAFSETISPPAVSTEADITIHVSETFLNAAIGEFMPGLGIAEATLDVLPQSRIRVTAHFRLPLISAQIHFTFYIGVDGGRVRISIEDIEAGSLEFLSLIGIGEVDLSRQIGGLIQQELEAQLGPGAQVLSITTDDEHIIISARWDP